MKALLLSLLVLAIPNLAQAETKCVGAEVYCDIVKLKPSVDKTFARNLARSISRYARRYGTNPKYSVAIAMQESSFANVNRTGQVLTRKNIFVSGVTDMGVFQLHVDTIGGLIDSGAKIDLVKLRHDVDYQTYWHVKILRKKIKTCTAQREKLGVEEGEEWSCYHSFTPKQRQTYVDYVTPYLDKITPAEAVELAAAE